MPSNIDYIKKGMRAFAIIGLLYEVLVCLTYGFFIRYREATTLSYDFITASSICLFILLGFGLLMTYIKDIPLSGVGFTFLITCVAFQHYFLINAFWTKAQIQPSLDDNFASDDKKYIGIVMGELSNNINQITQKYETVTYAFRCALSMVCAFSCIIGRGGPLEALIMTLVGTVGYELNSQIITRYAVDFGGSIRIFTFAGFFGYFTSIVLNNSRNSTKGNHPRYNSCRWSAAIALIGSLFIWCLFPLLFSNSIYQNLIDSTFNAMRFASVFNIIMALTGSMISTLMTSLLLKDRIGIRDLVYAPTAGGVSIMTSANIITNPSAALAVGVVAGAVQTFWLNKADRNLNKEAIRDSSGALGLFGIAGLIGGIWSAVFMAFQQNYSETKSQFSDSKFYLFLSSGGYQIAATFMSAGIAIVTGLITGLILRCINQNDLEDQFTDSTYWDAPQKYVQASLPPISTGMIRPASEVKGKFSYM